jgi:hypothetical protein
MKFKDHFIINPLAPELNPSAQRRLPRFFTGILIFKGLTARRLYKSFGVKGLNTFSFIHSIHQYIRWSTHLQDCR